MVNLIFLLITKESLQFYCTFLLFIYTNMDFFSLMFTPFAHPAILAGGTLVFFLL